MCEDCVRKAAEIDPRILKLMADVQPDIEKLKAKLSIGMREVLEMEIVNLDGDEPTEELDPRVRAEVRETMAKLSGILGLAYAMGWDTAINAESPQDLAMHISPMMGMLNRAVDEGLSYNYVLHQRKH